MSIENKVFGQLNKVELESRKIEFKLDPIQETKDIQNLFEKAADIRYQSITESINKINPAIKSMVDKRAALYRDMMDFAISYEKLIGESANNTTQVKAYKKAIELSDKLISNVSDSLAELNRIR